jgi:hypothetical protein
MLIYRLVAGYIMWYHNKRNVKGNTQHRIEHQTTNAWVFGLDFPVIFQCFDFRLCSGSYVNKAQSMIGKYPRGFLYFTRKLDVHSVIPLQSDIKNTPTIEDAPICTKFSYLAEPWNNVTGHNVFLSLLPPVCFRAIWLPSITLSLTHLFLSYHVFSPTHSVS